MNAYANVSLIENKLDELLSETTLSILSAPALTPLC